MILIEQSGPILWLILAYVELPRLRGQKDWILLFMSKGRIRFIKKNSRFEPFCSHSLPLFGLEVIL